MTNDTDRRFAALRKAMLGAKSTCEIDGHVWTPDVSTNTRIVRCLMNEGYRTFDDALAILTIPTLPPNFGKKCWLVVYDNLHAMGKV